MSMSAGDVMNYAGGLTSAIGGGDKSDSSKSAGSGTNDSAKSSDTGDSGNNLDTAPVLFGFGTGGTLLKHDMSALINETVEISDAGTLLAQAVAQLDSPNTQQKNRRNPIPHRDSDGVMVYAGKSACDRCPNTRKVRYRWGRRIKTGFFDAASHPSCKSELTIV